MNIENERAAFEAWLFKYYPKAKELGIVYRPDENLYEDRQTQIRWIVWKAAKAQAELEIEQSMQSKIDELNCDINVQKEQLNKLDRVIDGYAIEVDELQKRVDALTLALDQIAYPIPHMQKEADLNGCELNGYWAVKMSEDHTYSKDIARRALEKEQALNGGGE